MACGAGTASGRGRNLAAPGGIQDVVLTTFALAFRTSDLRKKIFFTIGILALFRFGANLPAPGIVERNVLYCSGLASSQGGSTAGVYALLNVLSGNALLRLTVFALGILPYITSSIVMQLLTQVIPKLDKLKDDGQAGQARITQYTRYVTVGLAVVEAASYVSLARSGTLFGSTGCGTAASHPLIRDSSPFTIGIIIVTMVAGTAVIMWMGELITERGVGNGMSVLMFTTILAGIPGELQQIYASKGIPFTLIAVVLVIAVVVCVVFIEQAQRRVPVQYAKRVSGRRVYGGTSTYIPLKVNQAGVIPIIFASSALTVPQLAIPYFSQNHPPAWIVWMERCLLPGNTYPLGYFVIMGLLILSFSYFYVSVTFNPVDVASNMQKYGGFVPGIRPARPTAEYLGRLSARMTAPGAVYLTLIALLPLVALSMAGLSGQFAFSGTSLLIVVGVGLDTVKQIESQLQQHNYSGFLRRKSRSDGTREPVAALDMSCERIGRRRSPGSPRRRRRGCSAPPWCCSIPAMRPRTRCSSRCSTRSAAGTARSRRPRRTAVPSWSTCAGSTGAIRPGILR
jgi:preprotein translocase subunit SecY